MDWFLFIGVGILVVLVVWFGVAWAIAHLVDDEEEV